MEKNYLDYFESIPDGLEFKEEYMVQAFQMYEAEKKKRPKAGVFWYVLTLVISLLLAGITFIIGKDQVSIQYALNKLNQNMDLTICRNASDVNLKSNEFKETCLNNANNFQDKKSNDISKLKKKHVYTEILISVSDSSNFNLHDKSNNYTEENIAKISIKKASGFDEQNSNELIFQDTLSDASKLNLPKNNFSLDIGANTLFGMKCIQNKVVFRECFGITYSRKIGKRLTLNSTLSFHSISKVPYVQIYYGKKDLNQTLTLANTTLNYFGIQPSISYYLNDKHSILLGFQFDYLLTNFRDKWEVDRYGDIKFQRNSQLYYNTFNKYNYSFTFGYQYKASPFLAVGATYHLGATDITKNSLQSSVIDRNSNLQLMLKINLKN